MKINCIIVDDEPLARKLLKEYIESVSELYLVQECADALEAMAAIEKQKVDLIFLDINMPKLTGLQLKKHLDVSIPTIFTTAYSEYAVEAFEVEAFDYLIKPISFERFLSSINRVKKHINKGGPKELLTLTIKENKRLYKIDLSDVLYLQAYGDYVRVYAQDKTYLTKEKLSVIEGKLSNQFIRIHRSYIINVSHLDYIEGNHAMINNTQLPISASYKNKLIAGM